MSVAATTTSRGTGPRPPRGRVTIRDRHAWLCGRSKSKHPGPHVDWSSQPDSDAASDAASTGRGVMGGGGTVTTHASANDPTTSHSAAPGTTARGGVGLQRGAAGTRRGQHDPRRLATRQGSIRRWRSCWRSTIGALLRVLASLVLASIVGCTPRPGADSPQAQHEAERDATPEVRDVEGSDVEGSAAPSRVAASSSLPASIAPDAEGTPVVVVTDPAVLAALEADGLSLGALVFGGGDGHPATFAADPGWISIRDRLARDLEEHRAADPKAGVGMRFAHRLFDLAWLSDPKVRFELVAVTNRIDRRAFDHGGARCGETRLVYRLAYATALEDTPIDSRLPMTVNVVFWQDGTCDEAVRRWPSDTPRSPTALATLLREGPLAKQRLVVGNLDAVEVNLQTVRWPAVVHPTLGGHAEYLMRVFQRGATSGGFAPSPLENTPDVARIAEDPARRSELREWIASHIAEIDAGVAVMPQALAADAAVSVTPRGLARLANRPFSQIFTADDLQGIALADATHTATIPALLRRLDELSCQGCHQTRSVAGFHILGEPRDPAAVVDTLAIAISPHLHDDLDRRRRYVTALRAGDPVDERRALASFEATRGYGSSCGLGDAAFTAWTCPADMTCQALDDTLLGICLPTARASAGDPCRIGTLRTTTLGHRDRVRDPAPRACAATAVCNVDRVGFPTGMCTAGCDALGKGEACGPIVDLTAFNACVGRRRPFPKCIELAARPVGLRACSEDAACRDDYVCARSGGGGGVCLPPYFLFQLRVDGHVL